MMLQSAVDVLGAVVATVLVSALVASTVGMVLVWYLEGHERRGLWLASRLPFIDVAEEADDTGDADHDAT